MKRTLLWVLGLGCAGAALAFIISGRSQPSTTAIAAEQGKPQPAKPAPAQAAPAGQAAMPGAAPSAGEKIIHTFEDKTKMEEFARFWQQRQGILLRMTVLQAYLNEEQTNLSSINQKLATDYQVDVTKNYALDTERRVLIEREPPAPGAPAESAAVQPGQQPAPAKSQ